MGGCERPNWEAMGGQSGRLKWEAKVGGHGRPCERQCERPCERPN